MRPWDTAGRHFNVVDDGLKQEWFGRVWLNPPYGDKTANWMKRMADHNNGIALIFARTETAAFFPWVWECAHSLFFLKGRLNFYTKEGRRGGTAGAPSVLIAYGAENSARLSAAGFDGKFVGLKA